MELVNRIAQAKGLLVFISVLTAASFLLCRVVFAGSFLPCGIALITALIYKNRLNIYLLPVMIFSLTTCQISGFYAVGDLAAVIICAVVFVFLGNRRWGLFPRSVMAVSITIIANCGYYLAAGMLYRFSIETLLFEAASVFALCYVFYRFLEIWFSGEKPVNISMEKILAFTIIVIMLAVCANGILNVRNVFSLSVVFGLFFTLVSGFKFGVMTGVMTGGICGIIPVLCAGVSPALLCVFVQGGLAAGFFKGQSRYCAAVCFAGACLTPGLFDGFPELSVSVYEPLVAGLMMLPLRNKWLDKLNPIEEQLKKTEIQDDIKIRDKLVRILDDSTGHFEFLENLYNGRSDGRRIISRQFGGMAQMTRRMKMEMDHAEYEDKMSVRHSLVTGAASYAAGGNVSGDSYINREFSRGGKHMMIISDGMGKGDIASSESKLVVNTVGRLLEAGFGPEKAIKTVNSILLMKPDGEMFSTIDMAIVDKGSAKLKLFKVGAAATYIKRGDKVAAFKKAALPAGIVDGLPVDYINVRLRHGDQIVMVSDGIIDSCRDDMDSEWLRETIRSINSKDPQTMADLIINRAVENYGLHEKDDLTVLTFRLD